MLPSQLLAFFLSFFYYYLPSSREFLFNKTISLSLSLLVCEMWVYMMYNWSFRFGYIHVYISILCFTKTKRKWIFYKVETCQGDCLYLLLRVLSCVEGKRRQLLSLSSLSPSLSTLKMTSLNLFSFSFSRWKAKRKSNGFFLKDMNAHWISRVEHVLITFSSG